MERFAVLLTVLCIAAAEGHPQPRVLQLDFPINIPNLPGLPGGGETANDYCDYVGFFVQSQVDADGFVCECTFENDEVQVVCTRDTPVCDKDANGFLNNFLCHTDSFTVTATTGNLALEGSTFEVTACSTYNILENAPDFLFEREFCFVYELSVGLTSGVTVNNCGVTLDPLVGSTPEQVCTCARCDDDAGGIFSLSLGLDCQVNLMLGVTLEQCLPLTLAAPVVFPRIASIADSAPATTQPSLATSPTDSTQPPATSPTDSPTMDPNTQEAATEPPTTETTSKAAKSQKLEHLCIAAMVTAVMGPSFMV